MGFIRSSSSKNSAKQQKKGGQKQPPQLLQPPQIKMVSRMTPATPDQPNAASPPSDLRTVATFNLYSNLGRDVVLRGAPPSIGRLLPVRQPSASPASSKSSSKSNLKQKKSTPNLNAPPLRPELGSPANLFEAQEASSSYFLSSGLPSAESTYPVLALLQVLRHENPSVHQSLVIDGELDIVADAPALAQVLRFQRERTAASSAGGSPSACSSAGLTPPSSAAPMQNGKVRRGSVYSASGSSSYSTSGSSNSPSPTSSSSLGSSLRWKRTRSKSTTASRQNSQQQQQQQHHHQLPQPSASDLRLHALLHNGRTLFLFSDLYQAIPQLTPGCGGGPSSPFLSSSSSSSSASGFGRSADRLKSALANLTHSPVLGSDEHKRAITYSAGGMNFLVHFAARASTATYPAHQPFVPVSHHPTEFAQSRIDYHVVPQGISLPLEHELLVHCALEGEAGADDRDEMVFERVSKLMEVRDGCGFDKDPRSPGVKEVWDSQKGEAEKELGEAAALVVPFLRKLIEEIRKSETKSSAKEGGHNNMVMLQQLDGGEVLVVEDVEPLRAFDEALKNQAAISSTASPHSLSPYSVPMTRTDAQQPFWAH